MVRSNNDRPVSAHTFGTPTLQAPVPQRTASTRTPDNERPTLIRSNTPNPAESQQDIARMFSQNMFADPKPHRHLKFGPEVLTDGHKRLTYLLREECGRLYSFTNNLKQKLTAAERDLRSTREALVEARNALHSKSERIVQLTAELREANDSLKEVDAMMETTRNKRLSRIYAAADDGTIYNA